MEKSASPGTLATGSAGVLLPGCRRGRTPHRSISAQEQALFARWGAGVARIIGRVAEDNDEDKSEEPTPQRLQKAREEGQVVRSRELTTFLLLTAGLGSLWLTARWFVSALLKVGATGFGFAPDLAWDKARMMAHMGQQMLTVAKGVAPLFGVLVVISLLAPNLLGGWLLSGKSIKFDVDRLNFFKGLGRMFSANAAAELGKAIAKSLLVGVVAVLFLRSHLTEFLDLAGGQAQQAIGHGLRLVFYCAALMVLAFVVVVAIDVPFQVWNHHKKLRMSRQDVKDELKEQEGDPQIKARIRSQQQQVARQRMMAAVPGADVVVTNPAHYAVALAYDESRMRAPQVVAKGVNEVAERIRELALAHEVPLLAAPPLARSLYRHAELGAEIPAALYTAVAEVLAWAWQLEQARRSGTPWPDAPHALPVPPELAVPSAAAADAP